MEKKSMRGEEKKEKEKEPRKDRPRIRTYMAWQPDNAHTENLFHPVISP